jgi:hypothetical protein
MTSSLMEVSPEVRALSRIDKLRPIGPPGEELAPPERPPRFVAELSYPVWSPERAYDAAAVLLKELEEERARP